MSVPQLVDKTSALVSTNLDARGLDELRVLLDMQGVPDETLLAVVESMREVVASQERFEGLVERVTDVSQYYDQVEPMFRNTIHYVPMTLGFARELTFTRFIGAAYDLFSILSEDRPYKVSGKIDFAHNSGIEIKENLNEIPTTEFVRRMNYPLGTLVKFEGDMFNASLSCFKVSTGKRWISRFPYRTGFVFTGFNENEGDKIFGINLHVNPNPEFPYTAESVKDFRRVRRNLRRYRL